MCTSITLTTKNNTSFIARTMDFAFELDAKPIFIPKHYTFSSDLGEAGAFTSQFSFIGSGRHFGEYFFADGINEKGIGACALYFSGYASFNDDIDDKKDNIPPHELISWILGTIDSLETLASNIKQLNIVGVKSKFLDVVVPLHWIVADATGRSVIIEITKDGLAIYDNEARAFTNSPTYPWHLANLDHYAYIQPKPRETMPFHHHTPLPDGAGSGLMGLPGDFTSQSRFVRTAYMAQEIDQPEDANEGISSLLHILASVDIPKGTKQHADGSPDYTQYKAMMDLTHLDYYMTSYNDSCPIKVSLNKQLLNQTKPIAFNINQTQTITDLSL